MVDCVHIYLLRHPSITSLLAMNISLDYLVLEHLSIMAAPQAISDTDYLSLPMCLTYFALYFILELITKRIFDNFNPGFFAKLHQNRKARPYFAFVMGMLVTLVSTPLCLQAWRDSSDANDVPGSAQMSTAGQLCLASRSVLWVSELNRLDFSNDYVVHHLASLFQLIYHLQYRIPLRPIYAIYASPITELSSDIASLMFYHGCKVDTSPWLYRTQFAHTILLLLLLPPILYAIPFAIPIPNNASPLLGRFGHAVHLC